MNSWWIEIPTSETATFNWNSCKSLDADRNISIINHNRPEQIEYFFQFFFSYATCFWKKLFVSINLYIFYRFWTHLNIETILAVSIYLFLHGSKIVFVFYTKFTRFVCPSPKVLINRFCDQICDHFELTEAVWGRLFVNYGTKFRFVKTFSMICGVW